MQTFHLPKEKGYYLQLKLIGHWAAFEQHIQADICMRNVKMRLWCICNFRIPVMFLIVLPIGTAWDTFPLAEMQPRKGMSCSTPPHYLFQSEITFSLLSLAEVWKNMLMTAHQGPSALGRQGGAGKERERGWIADSWLCLLEGTSAGQQQHWPRTPPTLLCWDLLGCSLGNPLLCCAPQACLLRANANNHRGEFPEILHLPGGKHWFGLAKC